MILNFGHLSASCSYKKVLTKVEECLIDCAHSSKQTLRATKCPQGAPTDENNGRNYKLSENLRMHLLVKKDSFRMEKNVLVSTLKTQPGIL